MSIDRTALPHRLAVTSPSWPVTIFFFIFAILFIALPAWVQFSQGTLFVPSKGASTLLIMFLGFGALMLLAASVSSSTTLYRDSSKVFIRTMIFGLVIYSRDRSYNNVPTVIVRLVPAASPTSMAFYIVFLDYRQGGVCAIGLFWSRARADKLANEVREFIGHAEQE
jgi:hypothetical protein